MNLRDLLHGITADPVAPIPIAGFACHSKQVRPGDLFVAIHGETTDGHAYIQEAIARGAAAIVAEHCTEHARAGSSPLDRSGTIATRPTRPCPCVTVPNSRDALVKMAAKFYGHPSRKLKLIGITGTNGKTTTTYLLKAILEAAGYNAGLLGTIVYHIGDRTVPSTNTTPGPLELQRYFAQMVGEGLQWCAMEVSSHALAQGRIDGLEFEAAIFSNLGSDHLDYHKTRTTYAAAKRRLFEYLRKDGVAVINADDEFGRMLAVTLPACTIMTYGVERAAKVTVKEISCTWQGIDLVLDTPWGVVPVTTPLLGRHTVSNIAAAATALMSRGIPPQAVRDGLASLACVPGRIERIPNDVGFNIVVDYAHTADALRMALRSIRELTRGRLIVVFGCGGNRDQTKRPQMGKIASLLADRVILTSDNPRGEDPLDILHQIKGGFPQGFRSFEIVPDREQAITAALASARPDDTVLIAGKGHEAYQLFNNISVPFLDRDVVERWISSRHSVAVS